MIYYLIISLPIVSRVNLKHKPHNLGCGLESFKRNLVSRHCLTGQKSQYSEGVLLALILSSVLKAVSSNHF